MYESYWQLKEKPFENTLDLRFYYPSESHQSALLKLRYAIENHRCGALLAGPSGSGKTLIVDMLAEVLDETCSPVAHLVFPQMPTAELLCMLADELEGTRSATEAQTVLAGVRRIQDFLVANASQNRHAVAVIDEAHLLDDIRTFESLRLLTNFEQSGVPAITILLVGQPAILPLIERIPQWEERLEVKCLLSALNEAETAAYIEHRLRTAGATRTIVDPDAFSTIHAITQGIPRRINRLCDLALLVGFAEEQPMLKAEHFEAVSRELITISAE